MTASMGKSNSPPLSLRGTRPAAGAVLAAVGHEFGKGDAHEMAVTVENQDPIARNDFALQHLGRREHVRLGRVGTENRAVVGPSAVHVADCASKGAAIQITRCMALDHASDVTGTNLPVDGGNDATGGAYPRATSATPNDDG
jgi:hypothetical protein